MKQYKKQQIWDINIKMFERLQIMGFSKMKTLYTFFSAMDLQTRSELVYAALCRRLKTTDQIKNRRDIVDISVKMNNKLSSRGRHAMDIGSRREGFRLEGSDMDHMFWHNHHRVVWESSQIDYTEAARQTFI